jgi:hypothetical protein
VIVNDRKQRGRDGNGATSADAKGICLGDINDLRAFVAKIARAISDDPSELEELVDEGIVLACEREKTCQPQQNVQKALNGWLELRLRDYWRKQHPEWRRNSRAGISYSRGTPTGLAWEHAETDEGMRASDESAVIDSRLRLRLLQSEADLRDPRVIGRLCGVPSHAGVATARANETWLAIEAERALTQPEPFGFHTRLD